MKTLVKLNDHLYVPQDFSKSHWYYADPEGKKKYTGVTTVCGVIAKPQLIGWAARMACEYVSVEWKSGKEYSEDEITLVLEAAKSAHTKKKEAAGEHGTDTHTLVENWVNECLQTNEGKPLLAWGADDPIAKFKEWAVETVDHFLFAERRMADPETFVAGTADFGFVSKNGRKFMADFKTSSGIYGIEYWLQVAAYRFLAEKNGDEPYDGQCVVRLGKDGSFEAQYTDNYVVDRDAFLAALTLYRAQAYHK